MESRSAKGFTVFGELMIRNLWSDNCMFESMYSTLLQNLRLSTNESNRWGTQADNTMLGR
jgi:hypothetical protein